MHNEHSWTERTEEGARREIRATKFGKKWRLQAKVRGEEAWTYYDDGAPRHDLEALLDILRRKYQRRRASHEDVTSVEKLLADSPPPLAPTHNLNPLPRPHHED